MAAVTDRAINRDTVRAFLLALAPRDAGGVRIDDGRRVFVVSRDAPLPWAAFERAARRGRELRAGPLPAPREGAAALTSVLWVHLPDGGPSPDRVAADLAAFAPAMVVRTGRGADVYWRVHPVPPGAAAEAMAALADALRAIAGDPGGFCRVPVAPGQLWAASPATVWAAPDLDAAARAEAARRALDAALREASLAGSSLPAASALRPALGGEAAPTPDEAADAVPWPEAEALLAQAAARDGVDPSGVLWTAAVRELIRQLGSDAVCRALGVEAIGVRGGAPCVLREGRWWRVLGGDRPPRLRMCVQDPAFDSSAS